MDRMTESHLVRHEKCCKDPWASNLIAEIRACWKENDKLQKDNNEMSIQAINLRKERDELLTRVGEAGIIILDYMKQIRHLEKELKYELANRNMLTANNDVLRRDNLRLEKENTRLKAVVNEAKTQIKEIIGLVRNS